MSLPTSENNFSQSTSNDQYPESVKSSHCDVNKRNWKCLILTLLTFVCLMLVVSCCFVTFTHTQTDTDPEHNSLCLNSKFFWTLVSGTVVLYALYFIECYNAIEYKSVCTRNIETVDDVMERIERMKNSEPIIWWKAICYHYVKRKKRSRDLYFVPKIVRKERINSYVSSSSFNFACCGVKDVSNTLILDGTVGRIIKFRFSKGFAFSNVTSAIEFEEQRSTFFRESRRYDEYMDIHEGLDLTDSEAFQEELFVLNSSGTRPWFTDPFYYWLSACCLLSWPFRLILYANTLPIHYKITKVFGMNHHTVSDSTHELALLRFYNSYGFVPSENDEASLWSGGTILRGNRSADDIIESINLELAPSYSEALLLLDDQYANIYRVESKNLSKTRFTYSAVTTDARNSYRNSFSSFFGVRRSTDEISSSLDELDDSKLPPYEEALLFPLVENYGASSNLREMRIDCSQNENSTIDRPSLNAQYEARLPIPRAFLSIETSL